MFAFRRSASRLLSSRHASFLSSRTYTSFSSPSVRISQRSLEVPSQRRWATTESEKLPPAPAAAETANATEATEEVLPAAETNERLTAETSNAPSDAAPGAAEVANATEATDETLPAAETNERFTATAERTSRDAAPGAAETANATEATEETLPAAEIDEQLTADRASDDAQAPVEENAFDRKRTLYIGNLFFDVTETDVVKEFSRFGTVTKCKIVRDSRGLSKGFAYIDYSTQEAADDAVKRLNMQLFEGRRVTVQYAARPSSSIDGDNMRRSSPRNPPSKTLFIGNMSFEMTDRDLSNLFRGITNVIDVRVAIDRRTGQPRGFAHADFTDVKSAMDAMKLLQEKEIYGRRLRVDYSYSSNNRAPRNDAADQGPEE